ncbi:unnamed protein product [Orchesella dallaii]|uniref:Replication-associated protein n=1 Tax=Orchesella dallaii TaxID=48710 RepID=A0ABP1PIE9_9HEXA
MVPRSGSKTISQYLSGEQRKVDPYRLLAFATSKRQIQRYMQTEDGKTWASKQFQEALQKKFDREDPPRSLSEFKEPWCKGFSCLAEVMPLFYGQVTSGYQTLYVNGPTGVGKTELMKSWFSGPEYLWLNSLEGLRRYDGNIHRGIIYDEFVARASKVPLYELLFFVDRTSSRDQRILYQSINVKSGTLKVIISNNSFDSLITEYSKGDDEPAQLNSVLGRLAVLYIAHPTFETPLGQLPPRTITISTVNANGIPEE